MTRKKPVARDKRNGMHGAPQHGITLTKIITIEIMAMLAWFFISYALWNWFDGSDVFKQPIFVSSVFIIGIILISITVVYSRHGKVDGEC
jgi:hypothetical protein